VKLKLKFRLKQENYKDGETNKTLSNASAIEASGGIQSSLKYY
jgi:hypothetical protein